MLSVLRSTGTVATPRSCLVLMRPPRHIALVAVLAAAVLTLGTPPRPARAADPAGAPNDAFLCYKGRRSSGTARLAPIFSLPITDAFETGSWDVRKRRGLCTPADRDDGGIIDATTHLGSYLIRGSFDAPPTEKRTVLVVDQFGLRALAIRKVDRLLVPSAVDPNEPVAPLDPATHEVDHYKCYRARVASGTPKFPKGLQTSVVDEFDQPAVYDVKKPMRLCVPASQDGQPIKNPAGYLVCYKVKEAVGELKFTRVSDLHLNNELEDANVDGPGQVDAKRREELCVPAVAVDADPVCTGVAADAGPAPDLCQYAVPAGPVFYVATDGSNATGDGSDASPWATITYAVTHVPDGSTVLVRPGTYMGRAQLDVAFAQGITIRSEVPYQAQLRNSSTVVAAFTGQGYTLEGFDIAHDGPGAGPLVVQIQDLRGDPGGADATGRITLRNNVIHDSFNNDLLKINNGARDIVVEGNVFYNQAGDDEHIDMNSVTDVVVRDNVFFNDFAGSGRADLDNTSNFVVVKDTSIGTDTNFGSARVAVRRNVFANWEGLTGAHFVLVGNDMLSYFGAHDVEVENNLMLGNTAAPMRAAVGVMGAKCVEVRYNTVAGDLPTLAYALRVNSQGADPPNEGIDFFGNVWSDPTGTMDDFGDSPPAETLSFALDGNLYWNGGQPIPVDHTELINVTDDAAAVLGDPVLGDQTGLIPPRWEPATGMFADGSTTPCEVRAHLVTLYGIPGPGSAAVDAGDPAHAPAHDILGNPRPAGSAPDIGAYEIP
jgi:hypothetical protein